MIQVETFDDLINRGADIAAGVLDLDELSFAGDLTLTIRITGQSWDGTIDYRGAQFVLDVQRAVNRLFREAGGTDIPKRELNKALQVKFKVSEGSAWWQVIVKDSVKTMIDKIPGNQTTLIIGLGMLCAAGCYTAKTVVDYKQTVALSQLQSEASQGIAEKLIPVLDKALDIIDKADLQEPPRKLVKKLDDFDQIQFHNQEQITAGIAKKRYPKKPVAEIKKERFDGKYRIIGLQLSTRPQVCELEKGGFKFKAEVELPDTDIEKLSSDLEEALKTNTDLSENIHLFIEYNKNGIKSAHIQGIGDPREGAISIQRLIEEI